MNKDKICKNCEYYECKRSIKNSFLGASVDCRNSKDNKCKAYKDQHTTPDCHCNCHSFKLWYAIEMQNEKEKNEQLAKREQKRTTTESLKASTRTKHNVVLHETHSETTTVSETLDLKAFKNELRYNKVKSAKNSRIAGIFAIIIGALGIIFSSCLLIFMYNMIDLANRTDAEKFADQITTFKNSTITFYIFLAISLILFVAGIITVILSNKKIKNSQNPCLTN